MMGDRRRVVVERVRPVIDGGGLAAKATLGVPMPVGATVIADGHDPLLAWAWHGVDPGPEHRGWHREPLRPVGDDRFAGWISPERAGRCCFAIVGLADEYGAWLRDVRIRLEAGQDAGSDLLEGAAIVDRRASVAGLAARDRSALQALAAQLRGTNSVSARVAAAGRDIAVALMRRTVDFDLATVAGPFPIWVERELAGFSAWYEMFPRSEGAMPPRGGTLRSASRRLSAIAGMGFDIVYLPPIHPIGASHRKGRNNSLERGPDDPGSPWAIGDETGGHDSVHPALGTLDDFDAFAAEARRVGLEVALDYALQCSPDHPWVKQHPRWFRHRVDGSIRYAENPPKRYQDIYPLDFGSDDAEALWAAALELMLFWIDRGVRVFRVDNPHTKPFAFWEWLIAEVHRRHPDVLLLAEAFTRPAVMQRLAKIGFSQSYTYFTWRNSKWEVSQYLHELSQTEQADWFRPNFWVNTPDILHAVLQHGGLAAFRLRAALAAITGPSWGMYSGYELGENMPLREGSEEYLDSEKYQLRPRNWDQAGSLAPLITQLNGIRRRHRAAIAQLDTMRLHHIESDAMLCVSRATVGHDDVVLLVLNLDPYASHEGITWLDLEALGLAADRPFEAHDELTDSTYVWQGPSNYVYLDPALQPAHIFHLRAR